MSIAIFNYGKGGGTNLNIKAYSLVENLPSSADEGTIAVITSVAIGDIYVSADEPTSPSSGDIWVWISSNSLVPVQMTDFIILHPRAIYQYNGSAWTLLESYVYHSGAWTELTLYLYDTGDFFLVNTLNELSNGPRYDYVSFASMDMYIRVHISQNYYYRADCAVFTGTVDLTNVDTIRLIADTPSTFSMRQFYISSGLNRTMVASTTITVGIGAVTELDVSNIVGNYYVGFYMGCASDGQEYTADAYLHSVQLVRGS